MGGLIVPRLRRNWAPSRSRSGSSEFKEGKIGLRRGLEMPAPRPQNLQFQAHFHLPKHIVTTVTHRDILHKQFHPDFPHPRSLIPQFPPGTVQNVITTSRHKFADGVEGEVLWARMKTKENGCLYGGCAE